MWSLVFGEVDALQPLIELRIGEARESRLWHGFAVVVGPHLMHPFVVKAYGFADVGPLVGIGGVFRARDAA